MVTMERPRSITIIVTDRKEHKSKSFVVYGSTIEEIAEKIKKAMEN
jgi:hypothetical protein